MSGPAEPRRFTADQIKLPDPLPWPAVACTPVELQRLRAAYQSEGAAHEVVAERVAAADQAIRRSVDFPPEGGQHNQWYQCDRCQVGLVAVDESHHRCPQCDSVYTGYPYDNVIYSRQHHRLTNDAEECAWAYALTGESRYAKQTRQILIGYGERYAEYPPHSANQGKRSDPLRDSGGHVFEQTLSEASWMKSICTAYDLIRNAEMVSEPDHQAIRKGLLAAVADNIARHRAGKSNWQTFHNSAFLYIGALLQRKDLVRRALCDPENGFHYQMDVSVLPGGMWYENSWSYHFYTLQAVERTVETARRLGLDLYSVPQVKQMYAVALDYRMADGSLPRFGDATDARIPGSRYEAAYHRWPEARFAALLPEPPTWQSIMYGRATAAAGPPPAPESVCHKGAGHALLHGKGPQGRCSAALTFGPFGGFHGHFDKLSFVYFALDRELGYDPGRARSQAYRLPVHRNWYRATISHNTVMVDRVSQEGAAGEFRCFVTGHSLSAAGARTTEAYPGVVHDRVLVLRPGFLVIADYLAAADGKEHVFDWLYHNLGERVDAPAAQQAGGAPDAKGFEYLEDVRTGATTDPVELTFTVGGQTSRGRATEQEHEGTVATGGNAGRKRPAKPDNRGVGERPAEQGRESAFAMCHDIVRATLDAQPGTEVLVGTGVGGSILHRVPMACVTRRGSMATFAAALDPTEASQDPDVESISIEPGSGGAMVVRVSLRGEAQEVYGYDPQGRERRLQEMATHARLLCLRREPGDGWTVMAESPK